MADLDDFFAKKDRKKNKGKKFTTTDEIAKKLEETGKKIEKTKKEKPPQPTPIPGQEGEEPIIESHGSAVETPASRGQRYSSEDLYKPRPLFNQQLRRTRGAASVPQSPVAGPASEVATKRRAPRAASADVSQLPKIKR